MQNSLHQIFTNLTSQTLALHVIFMLWEPTHSGYHARLFCLKILWVVPKLLKYISVLALDYIMIQYWTKCYFFYHITHSASGNHMYRVPSDSTDHCNIENFSIKHFLITFNATATQRYVECLVFAFAQCMNSHYVHTLCLIQAYGPAS